MGTSWLFVGDDWAEAHHDVELMDGSGRRLAKARLPEGVVGMARLHAMVAEELGDAAEDEDAAGQVLVGIETDRGPWVQALIAAGYTVYAVNPLQASRYRERLAVSGAKSDAADAHMLADMVRTDSHQLRPVSGDTADAEAVKVVTRMHKTLIWERTRATQRLRHALREYFPAALEAFEDLDAADTLELLARAPDPASAAKLTTGQISAALKRARRRGIEEKTIKIQTVLRGRYLGQPAVVTAAYAASVGALVAVLAVRRDRTRPVGLEQHRARVHRLRGHRRQPDPDDAAGVPVHRDTQLAVDPPQSHRIQAEYIQPGSVHQQVLAWASRAQPPEHPARPPCDVPVAFRAQPERRVLPLKRLQRLVCLGLAGNSHRTLTEAGRQACLGAVEHRRPTGAGCEAGCATVLNRGHPIA